MPGLSLLNPLLLATLAVALIPLSIHFFSRTAARTVPFSTLAFLRQAVARKSKQFKLESRNLLILRLLAVALVALALARPVVKFAGTAIVTPGTSATAVLILDNSLSMAAVENARQRFDRAKEAASDIVSNLAENDEVAVLLASSQPVALLPEPTNQREEAVDLIRNAPLSYGGTNIRDSLVQALEILGRVQGPGVREIYILSDMQANGWSDVAGIGAELRTGEVSLYLCDMGKEGSPNSAITGVRVDPSVARPGSEVRTVFQVVHYGPLTRTDAGLLCHYSTAVEPRQTVDLPPGEAQSVTFRNRYDTEGIQTGYGRLDADILQEDNTRYFTAQITRDREVLVLDGSPEAGTAGGSAFFLATALRVYGEQGTEPLALQVTERSAQGGIPEMPLVGYDLVIVSDVARLTADDVFRLRNFAERGGGVILFLGPNVTSDNYNTEASPGLIPAELEETVNADRPGGNPAYIQETDYSHPALALFRTIKNGDLRVPRFSRYWRLRPMPEAQVLARLQTKDPLLVEQRIGRGAVWTFASTADETWSNFPEKKIYLPFWIEAARHLSSRAEADFMFDVGESVPVRIVLGETIADSVSLPVTRPDGTRDTIQVSTGASIASTLYTGTTEPGVYRIHTEGIGAVESVHPNRFAVNPIPAESDLTRITANALDTVLDGFRYQTFEDPNAVAENLETARAGTPLWGILLVAILLLLTGETFYSHRVWR